MIIFNITLGESCGGFCCTFLQEKCGTGLWKAAGLKRKKFPTFKGQSARPPVAQVQVGEPLNLAVGRGIIDCDKLGGVKELKLHENQSN